ncbi:hypothetical protein PHYPSEUDO_002585 [Phytophthora pseudosyringae]|uniref:Uncharacterized protein n=1 Tax=Phytophthora pseudosyringae TaxID=221518 RepID=A0A8T1VX51_9STRA|nr:hypothetical protein PHYPSEUDO_002585 [Phytophthora pseudosyringae]
MVFNQLRSYLNNAASQDYITYTVRRLSELAKDRRFKAFWKALPAGERTTRGGMEIKQSWLDTAPARRQEKYEGLTSYWDLQKTEHQQRLSELMHSWVIVEKATQREWAATAATSHDI